MDTNCVRTSDGWNCDVYEEDPAGSTCIHPPSGPGYIGGCTFATNNDPSGQIANPGTQTGEISGTVIGFDAFPAANPAFTTVDCSVTVNGATVCATSGSGSPIAAAADVCSYVAVDGDVVELCQTITVNGTTLDDTCYPSTSAEFPPQEFWDIVDPIVGGPIDLVLSLIDGLQPRASCDDGTDNDGDGFTDMWDPGCTHPADSDERGTIPCDDGADNDADATADYPSDAGCSGPFDDNERGSAACDDGSDNDGDGLSDYPNDPGCGNATDSDEGVSEAQPWIDLLTSLVDDPPTGGVLGCDDGLDNDGDGFADSADPGCEGPTDPDERGTTACDDGLDNDGDIVTDYPDDAGCTGPADTDEGGAACGNGVDEDGDGLADYPRDPGCADPSDSSERSSTLPCDDGVDNDNDGGTDYPADAGCRTPADPNETTIP